MDIVPAQNVQLSSGAAASAQQPTSRQEKKLAAACRDFEALFISKMLKTMRSANHTEGGLFGKGLGGDLFQDLFDTEVARSMASNQGMGMAEQLMAKLREKGLMPDTAQSLFMPDATASERIRQFDDIIEQAAEKEGLDPALLYAVIETESSGNPYTVSSKGAKGLMQLMDSTAHEMSVANAFDPAQNIRGGTGYLKRMLNRFDGDLDRALAAYNAGPSAVERYGDIPPFEETQNYVRRVKALMDYYRQQPDEIEHQV